MKIRRWANYQKAVRKPRRHPQLMMIVRRQQGTNTFAEGWRPVTHVHRDIVNLASHHAYQLALWSLQLVMQPAQNALRGLAVIVLHKPNARYLFVKQGLAKRFHEKASMITVHSRLQQQDIRDRGRGDFHIWQ